MIQLNNETIEELILKNLAYADVFGWPMAEKEICNKFSNKLKIKNAFKKLIAEKKIACENNYYFLYGRKGLVERRLLREKWAAEKMVIARKAAGWLKIIPSILLVGVSGGLAVGNIRQDDDIDLFIICRNGTLWTTRFLSIILLEMLGRRRRPGDKDFNNKICLNMFVDEEGMAVPKPEQDEYTAHEIGNLKVLWERNGTYRKFLKANQWRVSCHSDPAQRGKNLGQPVADRNYASLDPSPSVALGVRMTEVERFFCWLQIKYMGKKRTREKIEPHRLLFHPEDKRRWVLEEYQKRLRSLG